MRGRTVVQGVVTPLASTSAARVMRRLLMVMVVLVIAAAGGGGGLRAVAAHRGRGGSPAASASVPVLMRPVVVAAVAESIANAGAARAECAAAGVAVAAAARIPMPGGWYTPRRSATVLRVIQVRSWHRGVGGGGLLVVMVVVGLLPLRVIMPAWMEVDVFTVALFHPSVGVGPRRGRRRKAGSVVRHTSCSRVVLQVRGRVRIPP